MAGIKKSKRISSEEFLDLYKQYLSIKKVSEVTNYSERQISRKLREIGTRDPKSLRPPKFTDADESPVKAYLLGVILGDGCIYKTNQNRGHSYYTEIKLTDMKFILSIAGVFGSIGLHSSMSRKKPSSWGKGPSISLKVSCKDLYNWLEPYKFCKRDAYSRASHCAECSWAFLRGIYESDGSLRKFKYLVANSYTITITNTDIGLVDSVVKVMKNLSLDPRVYTKYDDRYTKGYRFLIDLNKQKEVKRFLQEANPCIKNPLIRGLK